MSTQRNDPRTESVTTEESEQKQGLLDQIAQETARVGARYMPTLTVKQFTEREKLLRELKEMLVEGIDYGKIPGTDKPVLLLPGAQKICTFFGYVPHYDARQIEDWKGERTGGEPLFYYDYTCVLLKSGEPVGEGRGSCNSWESKYRFRWVKYEDVPSRYTEDQIRNELPERTGAVTEFAFAVDKGETSGQYGKPTEYWQKWRDAIKDGSARKIEKRTKSGKAMDAWEMGDTLYRVTNEAFPDVINTCQKMGQKRAYVAATLSATGASQYFTQDLEDGEQIDTGGHPKGTQAAADHVRDAKLAGGSEPIPEDPALAALFVKLTNIKERQPTITGLCECLDVLIGKEGTDKVWSGAAKGRDANANLGVARAVTQALYEAIARAEANAPKTPVQETLV